MTDQGGNFAFDNVLVTINPIIQEDGENYDEDGKGISRKSNILTWLGVIGLVSIVIIVCLIVVKKRREKDGGT